jgi:hypothetical protein
LDPVVFKNFGQSINASVVHRYDTGSNLLLLLFIMLLGSSQQGDQQQ